MLDALAFLPVDDVNAGMAFLLDNIPQDSDELCALIAYFDGTCVNGTARRSKRPAATGSVSNGLQVRLRRIRPMFPPVTWNVFETTLNNQHRTNNECESWNNGFRQLVGHAHPSVWTAIEALQQDQSMASTALLQFARGQPPAKRIRRETVRHQDRLRTLCQRKRAGEITMPEFLRAVAHTIRLDK